MVLIHPNALIKLNHYAFFILPTATLTDIDVTEPRPPALEIHRVEMTVKRHVAA